MSQPPCLPGLFGAPAKIAAPSLENWARIRPTLTAREIQVALAVYDYLRETGFEDVTGGELAAQSGIPILSVRPRICGLVKKGWLESGEMRSSRAANEARCNPVWPVLPRSAVERARKA